MKRLQQCVDACNSAPAPLTFIKLKVGGVSVGKVNKETAKTLLTFTEVFSSMPSGSISLSPELELASPEIRSEALGKVAISLREQSLVSGWRDELVTVAPAFGAPPVFSVERAVYPLLGVAGYGAHVNGFVKDKTAPGGIRLWVATRSKAKQTWPGLRDHIVAGQVSEGLSPMETVIKECEEEAGIPESLAQLACPAGAVSYRGVDEVGRLKNDVLFVFDLELPSDFTPKPVDGEVEKFELCDLEKVVRLLEGEEGGEASPEFKPNVALVLIDFLVRRGFIPPEAPGYLPLVASLRAGSCA
jgi:isopentenyldiphosphate isomerase